jgi:hypothetical protein
VVIPLKRYFEENGAPEKRHSYVLCGLYHPLHTYKPFAL